MLLLWFFLCKLFFIVVQKGKLKLYSLWLMYFQINKILVVLYGSTVPGKTASVESPAKAVLAPSETLLLGGGNCCTQKCFRLRGSSGMLGPFYPCFEGSLLLRIAAPGC